MFHGLYARSPNVRPIQAAKPSGLGMTQNGIQNLAWATTTLESAGAGAVVGATIGVLAKGDMKSAGWGGLIGLVFGAALGGFTGYEAKKGPTS